MKKIVSRTAITFIVALMITCSIPFSAYAENNQGKNKETNSQRVQQNIEKRQTPNEVKALLQEKKDAMIANKQKLASLREQNKTLHNSINQSLKKAKANNGSVDQATLDAIDNYKKQLIELRNQVSATKDSIKAIMTKNKESVRAKDYTGIQAAFDKIYSIQNQRIATLTQMNEILNKMASLFNKA
ncbi:hypothetical protein RBG61_04955 [Paludicola sp. MB14-C6]|uniref:hypothetical protein n=1 Tax=Paludihabitans sp. MB14-C6 TaxID=3070656 RepID=UPI0027DDB004|nr:hypothetical protein [Paludicola sp. MB14-C6]WMJ24022.1 hypothetical protein RBG61_04955 [Paludicola sp. MB14-C6]